MGVSSPVKPGSRVTCSEPEAPVPCTAVSAMAGTDLRVIGEVTVGTALPLAVDQEKEPWAHSFRAASVRVTVRVISADWPAFRSSTDGDAVTS